MIIVLVYIVIIIVIYVVRMVRISRRRAMPFTSLFATNYLDSKAFYMYRFNEVPCIGFINELDSNRACEYLRQHLAGEVVEVYQHNQYNYEANDVLFNVSIYVLSDGRMIELGNGYAEILHRSNQYAFAENLIRQLVAFRVEAEVSVVAESFNHIPVAGFMRQHEMN